MTKKEKNEKVPVMGVDFGYLPNPTATMPAGDNFRPCKPCKGRGYDPKDDSLLCVACNGTGDGRYVWNPSDPENPSPTLVIPFTNKYKGTFGIWSNGRKIKQATGSELRYLKRVNFWVVSFTLLMVALCAAWGYWFITVGLYTNAGIIK